MGQSMPRIHLRGHTVALAPPLLAALFTITVPAAPITLTVPYVASPVADVDLDGDPSTGVWSDATSFVLSLENGRTAGDHFWFGMLFSTTRNGHHQSGQDSVFFGEATLRSTTPILPVDANGGGKPPSKDTQQDAVGEMRAFGAAQRDDFTAEWRRGGDTTE